MNLKFLILSFIVVIQIGGITSELIRFQLAKQVSYTGEYSKRHGRYIFHSETIQSDFDQIATKHRNVREEYINSPEWKKLVEENWKNRAKFEISSKLINIFISALGISFFLYYRSIENDFSWNQLLGILFSMFFMKDVLINFFDIIEGGILCNEAAIWHYLNLSVFQSSKIYAFIGIICLSILIYLVHPKIRAKFIFGGFLGSIIGICLWLFISGPLFLNW